MKKLLTVISLASLVCTASSAFANNGAMDLSWNHCDWSAASMNKSYACDASAGTIYTMTGAFIMPFDVADFAGVSAAVDIETATPTPDYWKTDASSCNAGALTVSNPLPGPPCGPNLFDVSFSGGGFSVAYATPTRVRVRIDWATGAPVAPSTVAGTHYVGFALNLDPDQGVINGCQGCQIPACIVLNGMDVYGFAPGEDFFITSVDVNNTVTWQSAGGNNCAGATPSQNKTWGSVKALYR
jgi:hypothetical protein